MTAPIRALILDADGVLQHPPPGWLLGWAQMGGPRFVQEVHDQELRALTGQEDLAPLVTEVLQRRGLDLTFQQVLDHWCRIELDGRMLQLADRVRAAGVLVAMGTNQNPYRGQYMLDNLPYAEHFDALFHSTEGYISAARNEFSKMVAAEAIRNVAQNLATSIREPENMEAMSAVALGSYLSGIQMAVGSCTSAHPLEHALSAYHEKLPHGAGLIMISKAYYSHFVEQHACDDRFIEMAKLMGMEDASKPEDFITALVKLQEDCGVADLKMSHYGIEPSEFPKMVQNARDTLGPNFLNDPIQLTDEDCVGIYQKSYR